RSASISDGQADTPAEQDITATGQLLHLGGSTTLTNGTASIPLPQNMFDGAGYRWDIQRDGEINDGTNDAYDGGLFIEVASGGSSDWFGGSSTASLEDGSEV